MTNLEIIKLFLEKYRLENKSINTIKAYDRILQDFNAKINKPFSELTLLDVDAYKSYKSGMALQTQNQSIMCIRSFVNYLATRKIIKDNFSRDIERITGAKTVTQREYMSLLEQNVLVEYLLDLTKSSIKSHRKDALFFLIALSAGLRKSEIINIKVGNIQITKDGEMLIVVTGKGNKERYAWIHPMLQKIIAEHIHDNNLQDNDYLFFTCYGNRLDPANVNNAFNRILDELGFRHYSVHDLRHACATKMFADGATKEDVQLALGHSSVNTTEQIYIHVNPERQTEGFRKSKLFDESSRN